MERQNAAVSSGKLPTDHQSHPSNANIVPISTNDGFHIAPLIEACEHVSNARSNYYASVNVADNAQATVGNIYNIYPAHAPISNDISEPQRKDTILKSLEFPEMFNRYRAVEEEHQGTCDWILANNFKDERWSTYTAWLATEEPLYWISGKPGSGKSVLMRYLNTKAVEDADAAQLVLSFWFWEAGVPLERNLEGCLRSLLWQCVQFSPDLASPSMFPTDHRINGHWTKRNLNKALQHMLTAIDKQRTSIKIFLDGLDESGPDAVDIVDVLDTLRSKHPHIKLCVSSRPEQFFKDSFEQCPTLRIQDFNQVDITRVIDDDLFSKPLVERLLRGRDDWKRDMRRLIHQKAQGVFLWVRLAIRALLRGITNRDQFETLIERLDALPGDLDSLYTTMLARSAADHQFYRGTAARYLTLILHRPMKLGELCLATNDEARRALLDHKNWNLEFCEQFLQMNEMQTWINVRSGGLLQVDPPSYIIGDEMQGSSNFFYMKRHVVSFIHRTVHTFLLNTVSGQNMLREGGLERQEIQDLCFEAALVDGLILETVHSTFEGLDCEHTLTSYCAACTEPSRGHAIIASDVLDILHAKKYFTIQARIARAGYSLSKYTLYGSNGNVDRLSLYCNSGWFERLLELLQTEQQSLGTTHATYLLMDVIYWSYECQQNLESSDATNNPVEQVIIKLRQHGASLTRPILSDDSTFTCIMSELPFEVDHILQKGLASERFMRSITGIESWRSSFTLTSRYLSLEAALTYRSPRKFLLLGDYTEFDITMLCGFSDLLKLRRTAETALGHIKVIGRSEDEKCDKRPSFFAISAAGSSVILTTLHRMAEDPTCGRLVKYDRPGALLLDFEDDGIHCQMTDTFSLITDICAMSKRCHDLPEALLHAGTLADELQPFLEQEKEESMHYRNAQDIANLSRKRKRS